MLGESVRDAVLCDWRTAAIDERLRAMLGFIETLSLRPDEIGADDVAVLRAAGISDDAIEDASFVCVLFTTYVRLADTFRFAVPPEESFRTSATMLLKMGYGFPSPVKWFIR